MSWPRYLSAMASLMIIYGLTKLGGPPADWIEYLRDFVAFNAVFFAGALTAMKSP